MSNSGQIVVGISGWRYEPWRGVFYPKGLPQHAELKYASRMLSSIELNGSFYSLQKPEYYAAWRDDTPDGFVFSVKAPRFITHIRRLKDVETPVANFFANGMFELKAKLGPILWQFPPQMAFSPELLEPFFAGLPHDTEAAAALAAKHDQTVKGRAALDPCGKRPMRHAVEVRNKSFGTPEFVELLRRYDIAPVIGDTAGKWPLLEDLTADFVYMRLHGDEAIYENGYTDEGLEFWAKRALAWSAGEQVDDARLTSSAPAPAHPQRDVFCYFDNDAKVRAPYDASRMMRKVGQDTALGEPGTPSWPPGWEELQAVGKVREPSRRRT